MDNGRPPDERSSVLGALVCLVTHDSGTLLVYRDSRLEKGLTCQLVRVLRFVTQVSIDIRSFVCTLW